jgi:PAS domain-containing protein
LFGDSRNCFVDTEVIQSSPEVPPMSTLPIVVTIPSSDRAFAEHVARLVRQAGDHAGAFEKRVRKLYPRVAVRERLLSGEAPVFYVYRDGRWRPPDATAWWQDAAAPRLVVDAEGWITEINATAAGLVGVDPATASTHHLTDFAVPGTLDDFVSLFEIVRAGRELDATVLIRPVTGDVIAVELHARRTDDDHVVSVFRLADDIEVDDNLGTRREQPPTLVSIPRTDVAFRDYALRALSCMSQPTADGLVLRLRRLYPHATVIVDRERWVAKRDPGALEGGDGWWRDASLASVTYNDRALITDANRAAVRLLGHELVGHHWQEFVTPGSTEQVTVMLEILAEIGAAESRFRMPRGDGSMLEFESYTELKEGQFLTVIRPVGD